MKTRAVFVQPQDIANALSAWEAADYDGVAKNCPLVFTVKREGICSGDVGVGSSNIYPDYPGARIPFSPPLPQELYSPGSSWGDLKNGWAWRRALIYASYEPYRFELELEAE